jgi:branched-chain amino acid transport system substrate-binding protein
MNKKNLFIAFALILLVMIGYYYNYNNNSKSNSIQIGVILPLTGEAASYGKNIKDGILLALEKYQFENPNSTNIKFIFEDSKANPKDAITSFEKLTKLNDCKVILGCFSSSEVLSVAPLAEKNKIVLISPTATAPIITKSGDYIFRIIPSDDYDGIAMANFAYSNLKLKKIGIININNDYGIGISNVFSKKIIELGGNIVEQKSFDANSKNFNSILEAIKIKQPDGIYIIAVSEIGVILKKIKEMGIKCKILTVGLAETPEVISIAKNASDSVYYSYPSFQASSSESHIVEFSKSYKSKYGFDPDVLAAYGFDLANITFSSLKGTENLNIEEFKTNLYNLQNFNGVTGKTSFDKNGDVQKSIGIKLINNGKFHWYINNF